MGNAGNDRRAGARNDGRRGPEAWAARRQLISGCPATGFLCFLARSPVQLPAEIRRAGGRGRRHRLRGAGRWRAVRSCAGQHADRPSGGGARSPPAGPIKQAHSLPERAPRRRGVDGRTELEIGQTTSWKDLFLGIETGPVVEHDGSCLAPVHEDLAVHDGGPRQGNGPARAAKAKDRPEPKTDQRLRPGSRSSSLPVARELPIPKPFIVFASRCQRGSHQDLFRPARPQPRVRNSVPLAWRPDYLLPISTCAKYRRIAACPHMSLQSDIREHLFRPRDSSGRPVAEARRPLWREPPVDRAFPYAPVASPAYSAAALFSSRMILTCRS